MVSCGLKFSVALSVQGEIYAWGENNYGQLGLGDYQLRVLPAKMPSTKAFRYVKGSY